jgi:hypothetical protein
VPRLPSQASTLSPLDKAKSVSSHLSTDRHNSALVPRSTTTCNHARSGAAHSIIDCIMLDFGKPDLSGFASTVLNCRERRLATQNFAGNLITVAPFVDKFRISGLRCPTSSRLRSAPRCHRVPRRRCCSAIARKSRGALSPARDDVRSPLPLARLLQPRSKRAPSELSAALSFSRLFAETAPLASFGSVILRSHLRLQAVLHSALGE